MIDGLQAAAFDALLARHAEHDWHRRLQATVKELKALLSDPAAFRSRIVDEIRASREANRLPDRSVEDVQAALHQRTAGGLNAAVRRVRRIIEG